MGFKTTFANGSTCCGLEIDLTRANNSTVDAKCAGTSSGRGGGGAAPLVPWSAPSVSRSSNLRPEVEPAAALGMRAQRGLDERDAARALIDHRRRVSCPRHGQTMAKLLAAAT